jgi:hypothetical protein
MPEVKIVGRGVDALVLNVSYADEQFQPVKQELAEDLQQELETLQQEERELEEPAIIHRSFQGVALYMHWSKRGDSFSRAQNRKRGEKLFYQIASRLVVSSGGRIRTSGLWVMSPTS